MSYGHIFGPNNPPKNGDRFLWIMNGEVINGLWKIQVSEDKKTAYNQYDNLTYHNSCEVTENKNYRDVLSNAYLKLKVSPFP